MKISLPGLFELKRNKIGQNELKIILGRHRQLKNANIDWRQLNDVDLELIQNVTSNASEVSFELNQDKLVREGFKNSLNIKCKDIPENIIVEFSSPNIAKPFHMGKFFQLFCVN